MATEDCARIALVDIPPGVCAIGIERRSPSPRGGFKDITGSVYHGSRVVGFAGFRCGRSTWLCECKCGRLFLASGHDLRRYGLSCGCNRLTHGLTGSPEHIAWMQMKQRCCNPKSTGYENYGGRGITVCDLWMDSFEAFIGEVGPRPSSSHSIDRIEVNGNYEPGNCRWATKSEQAKNRRPRAKRRYANVT